MESNEVELLRRTVTKPQRDMPSVTESCGCCWLGLWVLPCYEHIQLFSAHPEDAPEGPWERKAPDAPGTWVRINIVGKPQLHKVFETDGSTLSLEAGLWMIWGWGGSERLVHPGPRQAEFLWLGPLPPPPENRLK